MWGKSVPRDPRIIVAGGIYHVFARGNNRQNIFVDTVDRSIYLRALTASFRLLKVRLLAYVLMSNHVHLVLQITEPNMDEAMYRLHSLYAHRFNRRHGRIGHTFNNRYKSRIIVDDAYLLEATCYVHLNPVDARLVAHPRDYLWSSYRQYVEPPRRNQLIDPNPVLSLLTNDHVRSREVYEQFVMTEMHRHGRQKLSVARGS